MKQVGDLLKKTREEQGLTLEQVSQKTKIHIQKLKAIEEGDQELLPAKVFTIGLVKSYARLLKVDQELFNQLCLETFDFHPEVMEVGPLHNNDEPTETQPVGRFQISKALSIFLSIIVSIGLIFIIYLVVNKMSAYSSEEDVTEPQYSEPATLETPPQDSVEKKDSLNKDSPPTATEAKPEQTVETAPVEEPKPPKDEDLKRTQNSEISSEVQKKAVDKTEPLPAEATVKSQNNEQIQKDIGFENQNSQTHNSQVIHSDNKISITSLEPVRVEIIWSDGYVQVMLMKSNETKTLVFSTPIQIKINNGGAVKVSYNDQKDKVPGRLNEPIDLKYP